MTTKSPSLLKWYVTRYYPHVLGLHKIYTSRALDFSGACIVATAIPPNKGFQTKPHISRTARVRF